MKYIKFFNEIKKTDSHQYGGKATSLGQLTQAGISVPKGFAISIEAYEKFAGKRFDSEFQSEILEAWEVLKSPRVAVRSSAVAEDGGDASWAGQLESYLNVDKNTLEKSIRKCWKSINSEHAVSYAKDKLINDDSRLVGVIVQTMVDSEKSGVMFTVDPVSKDINQMIIESIYGLGEMIVQGIITPDRYTLSKKPLVVTDFDISIKNKKMIYMGGKNRIVSVQDFESDKATLTEKEVISLAEFGLKIEKYYKSPQDIEWAYVNQSFYAIQSRPITTL
jgi:phosphoenolpyruvate synthase/pyruvate phosphate dikinase